MRTFHFAISASLALAAPAGAATRNYGIRDFTKVRVVGTASAKLGGKATKLTVLVRGISALDGTDLAATDASIGTEGAATVDANVRGEANISSSGPATIRLTGRPTCTLRTGSSATVSGCR